MLAFALYELPSGLCVDAAHCLAAIKESEALALRFPHLHTVISNYNGGLDVYARVLADWLAYQKTDKKKPFVDCR